MEIQPDTFQEILELLRDFSVEIIRGGDPIKTFYSIINSDILVMSRSFMSFVAALYSKGKVFYPPNFWHRPLKELIKFF